jgi:hypothetical protein
MGLLTLVALLNPPSNPERAGSDGGGLGLGGLPPFGEGGSSGEVSSSRSRGRDSQMRGGRLPDELEGLTVTAVVLARRLAGERQEGRLPNHGG